MPDDDVWGDQFKFHHSEEWGEWEAYEEGWRSWDGKEDCPYPEDPDREEWMGGREDRDEYERNRPPPVTRELRVVRVAGPTSRSTAEFWPVHEVVFNGGDTIRVMIKGDDGEWTWCMEGIVEEFLNVDMGYIDSVKFDPSTPIRLTLESCDRSGPHHHRTR